MKVIDGIVIPGAPHGNGTEEGWTSNKVPHTPGDPYTEGDDFNGWKLAAKGITPVEPKRKD